MKKNLEIENASEIQTLQTEYTVKVEQLNDELVNANKTSEHLQKDKEELMQELSQLNKSLNTIKEELETQRNAHNEQLLQLQQDLEEKEKVTTEIKSLQQQTKNMVKRAQDDWESKNQELKRIKREQESLEAVIIDLLQRFRPNDPEFNRLDLNVYIHGFKKNLEEFEHEYDLTKDKLATVTKELAEVTHGYTSLIDVHNEWRTIASSMAEKLEEYRKQVVFEIINQLQLPVEEEELAVLQKKVTPSDDDTAMWTEIMQIATFIDTQKFVHRVHKRVKDNYEQAKNYKKEYKNIKGKKKVKSKAKGRRN